MSMTEEEAENIFEYKMTDPDFWYVTGRTDNRDILQEVLDTLFNTTEGNSYKAKYMSQSYSSRLVVYCGVCRKDLSSYDPFTLHNNGKPHKKAVSMLKSQIEKEGATKEINFKDPLSPLNIFERDTFEDKVDHVEKLVVGLQFVYKERRDVDDELYFTCQLCSKEQNVFRISEDDMILHVTSPFHIIRFMYIVHGIREENFKRLMPHVERLIYTNGRITHSIIEFDWNSPPGNFPRNRENLKRSLSPNGPPGKTRKEDSYPGPSSTPKPNYSSGANSIPMGVRTIDVSCEANIRTKDIKDFEVELGNCVQEEEAICSLLKNSTSNDREVMAQTAKVLSGSLRAYCRGNDVETEFNTLVCRFYALTLDL